jgi:hypothetical protein
MLRPVVIDVPPPQLPPYPNGLKAVETFELDATHLIADRVPRGIVGRAVCYPNLITDDPPQSNVVVPRRTVQQSSSLSSYLIGSVEVEPFLDNVAFAKESFK